MPGTIATGIQAFDEQVGGLPTGTLVQVYGPAGSGKSSLALTLARHITPCCLVLAERLHRQRVADVISHVAQQVLVARPSDLDAQDEALERACGLLEAGRVQGLVLDSLTFLYRFTTGASKAALSRLFDELGAMHQAARAGEGTAVFTNQVRGGPNGQQPIGGPGVRHVSDVILSLETSEGAWRRLTLEKHPFMGAGRTFDIKITTNGIE